MQRQILFVCTGNIFRSLTAEYALRAALRDSPRFVVESAGTEDFPHVVKPIVRDYLLTKGFDVRSHRRRTVTSVMLAPPTLVIAMSTEHRAALRDQFDVADVPLFTAACGFAEEPLPDVDEAVADFATNPAAADAHVRATIDRIIAATPHLARRLASDERIA
jgi:protein-tyrosine phosphatase